MLHPKHYRQHEGQTWNDRVEKALNEGRLEDEHYHATKPSQRTLKAITKPAYLNKLIAQANDNTRWQLPLNQRGCC